MKTFAYSHLLTERTSERCWDLLAKLHEDKGRMNAVCLAYPELLTSLEERAFFENVSASSSIEGVELPEERIRELIAGDTPQSDKEHQVAGYARCLRALQQQPESFGLSTSSLLAFHTVIFSGRPMPKKSHYRQHDFVTLVIDDAPQNVPLSPITAFETPLYLGAAVDDLAETFAHSAGKQLLLVPLFNVDLLCIRPFDEANGRVVRLFSNLMLEKTGFDITRYVSMDRLFNSDAAAYYEALNNCTKDWEKNKNTYEPFSVYWLATLHEAYQELFEKTAFELGDNAPKAARIQRFFERRVGEFSKQDVLDAHPDISLSTVENALCALVKQGAIEKIGQGRATVYRAAGPLSAGSAQDGNAVYIP